jgi:type II secretory pathway pseudopilin PulG
MFSNPLVQYGAVAGGTQIVGGMIAGAAQQKAAEEQRQYEAETQARLRQEAYDRYNTNVGGSLWSGQRPPQTAGYTPYWAQQNQAQPTGLINRNMPQMPPGYGVGRLPPTAYSQG